MQVADIDIVGDNITNIERVIVGIADSISETQRDIAGSICRD
jgi:hypothetical protein